MRPLFEILGGAPAWEEVAVRHGLALWVVDELVARGRPASATLQSAARAQLASGARVKRLTLGVLDALSEVAVTPTVLKGYGLASRLFPAQPLGRPSSDVDLLIHPDEVPRAEACLERLGLQPRAIPGVEDAALEHHHFAWSGPSGLVELHFRLFVSFGRSVFDDEGLRGRCREGALDGRRVLWLGSEDEFLYLAVHAANHGFLRLSWLVDLARYVEKFPSLDWSAMQRRAQRAGLLSPFLAALELTERLLGVPLPSDARQVLAHSRLRRRLHPFVFSLDRVADARWSNDRLASFILRLYLVDSPAQGLRHVLDGARRYLRQRRAPVAQV